MSYDTPPSSSAPRQFALDLGVPPTYAESDFLPSDGNAAARAWIARWPDWSAAGLVLCGAAGSGKTHLAEILRQRSGGRRLSAAGLQIETLPALLDVPLLIIEDADTPPVPEVALFHLFNLCREQGVKLLLTGQTAPAQWPLTLPDWRSRLLSLPVTAILPPDDALLQALLLKLFSDRQLRIGPDVLAYLLPRLERSCAALREAVAAIDREALAQQRPVTVPLVRAVLAAHQPDPDKTEDAE